MNNKLTRRGLLKAIVATAISPYLVSSSIAETLPHIIVVGGGFAGATAAKYLKLWGGHSVQVTIIEPNSTYVSPILSNLVLNQQKTTNDLSFNYVNYSQKYGINMVHANVDSINKTNKQISLSTGSQLTYDKLILAPGIEFNAVPGHDFSKVPHAWKAGEQTNLLKSQIAAMKDGDHFVMSIPASPFRCPPGPYERACVIADYLKNKKGFSQCQVTVLDENSGIIVEADTFGAAFAEYKINYIASALVESVDPDNKIVSYSVSSGATQTLSATVLNVIPNQKAGDIIFAAGLNEGNWAPVNPLSYESTLQSDIHIIGDSQGTSMPKAGHIGNSEAKICADAVLRSLNGLSPDPAPKTNSACYSPISSNTATWLTIVYEYNSTTGKMQAVSVPNLASGYPAASSGASTKNYNNMFNWTGNLFSDTFS